MKNTQDQLNRASVDAVRAMLSEWKYEIKRLGSAQSVDTADESFQAAKSYLREHTGAYIPFKDYVELVRVRLGIPQRDYTVDDLLRLLRLYTYGKEPLVRQNYWYFYYYLGCLIQLERADDPVWLSRSNEQEAQPYWDMHCKGGNYSTIYDTFCRDADLLHPELSSAIETICKTRGIRHNPDVESAYYYCRVASAAVDPCKSDEPLDIYARCATARGICMKALMELYFDKTSTKDELPFPEQVARLVAIWAIRLLTLEESHGSGLAGYELYQLGQRDLFKTRIQQYGPAIMERLNLCADKLMGASLDGCLGNYDPDGFARAVISAQDQGINDASDWLRYLESLRITNKKQQEYAETQALQAVRNNYSAELSAYRERLNKRATEINLLTSGLYLDGDEMEAIGWAAGGADKELGLELQALGMMETNWINEKMAARQEKLVEKEMQRAALERERAAMEDAEKVSIHKVIDVDDAWLDSGTPGKTVPSSVNYWKENDEEARLRQMMAKVLERMEAET